MEGKDSHQKLHSFSDCIIHFTHAFNSSKLHLTLADPLLVPRRAPLPLHFRPPGWGERHSPGVSPGVRRRGECADRGLRLLGAGARGGAIRGAGPALHMSEKVRKLSC